MLPAIQIEVVEIGTCGNGVGTHPERANRCFSDQPYKTNRHAALAGAKSGSIRVHRPIPIRRYFLGPLPRTAASEASAMTTSSPVLGSGRLPGVLAPVCSAVIWSLLSA